MHSYNWTPNFVKIVSKVQCSVLSSVAWPFFSLSLTMRNILTQHVVSPNKSTLCKVSALLKYVMGTYCSFKSAHSYLCIGSLFLFIQKKAHRKAVFLSQVRCELSWSCLPAGYIFCLVDFKEPLATWRQLEENVNTHSTELFDLAVSYQCPWLATIIQPKRINNGYKLKFDEARCSTPNDNSLLLSI